MSDNVARGGAPCQEQPQPHGTEGVGQSLTQRHGDEGKSLTPAEDDNHELALVRQAIECHREPRADGSGGWTHEALATVLPVPSAAYVSRMLSGERPWTLRHTAALPREIKRTYHALALKREGLTVVEPLPIERALQALADGLFSVASLATAALPPAATALERKPMAKASLPVAVARKVGA